MPDSGPSTLPGEGESAGRDQLVLAAASEILRPLVGMLLANGVKHGVLVELLKRLLVEAARGRVPGGAGARAVSRISVATGIHRKEVKRLLHEPADVADLGGRSLASEAFTRWLTDPRFLDAQHQPRVLARHAAPGAEPSFESLAREVSRDVHSRTILDELLRLKMVELDGDGVRLVAQAFVPAARERDMLRFLADNIGDHLSAAVANAEERADRFLEQAMFSDELSADSIRRVEALAREHWQRMLRELAPKLQALVDEDRAAGRTANRRARIGMYSYSARMTQASDPGHARNGDEER